MTEAQNLELIHKKLQATFNSGKTKEYAWRYNQIKSIRKFVDENEEQLSKALTEDLGRHSFEAKGLDLLPCLVEADHILANLKQWMKPVHTPVSMVAAPAASEIAYEPFGTCLVLGPFNYPMSLTISPLMGAIAAGNCVVIKPSEMPTAIEKLLVEVLPKYVDGDAVQIVQGEVKTTTELLRLRWDKIFFTGSPRVGKIVMKAAAEHLTPVCLELGGKSPTIVDKSVTDLELAAQRILWGKCCNAGQTCIAPDYVFCHEKHYDQLLDLLQRKIKQFYGDDVQNAPDFARIITSMHAKRLKGMIDECGEQRIVTGGNTDVDKKFVTPTILKDVRMDSKVMTEEIFGPILPVLPYSDISSVIKHIKSGEKPLTMYIFAKDRKLIDRLTKEVSSGSVLVNDTLFQFANLFAPFGGVGESGLGGYHGVFSFYAFSHQKSILRRDDHAIFDVPFRYPPYTDFGLNVFRTVALLPYTIPSMHNVFSAKNLFNAVIWVGSVAAATAAVVHFHN